MCDLAIQILYKICTDLKYHFQYKNYKLSLFEISDFFICPHNDVHRYVLEPGLSTVEFLCNPNRDSEIRIMTRIQEG